jgi:hypothetical protein
LDEPTAYISRHTDRTATLAITTTRVSHLKQPAFENRIWKRLFRAHRENTGDRKMYNDLKGNGKVVPVHTMKA